MYCTKCGEKLPDGVKFCPSCGTPISAAQDTASSANNATSNISEPGDYISKPEEQDKSKAKSHRWIIFVAVAIILLVVVTVFMSSGGMSNKELKALAQNGGVSPYEFKQIVTKEYGKKNYEENIDLFKGTKAELNQYCHIENAGTYAGVTLFTYPYEIDTYEDNIADSDLMTIATKLALGIKVYTNDDYSYYQILLYDGNYGNYDASFRIVGNSAIFVNPYMNYRYNGYEILSSLDENNDFKMNEVDTDNLRDISEEFLDAINGGSALDKSSSGITPTATFYYRDQNGEEKNYVLTGETHYTYKEDGELKTVNNTTYDYELSSDGYIVSEIMNTDDGRKSPQIHQYKYDRNGNLIEDIYTYDGSTIETKEEYEYNDKNQLITRTYDRYKDGKSRGVPITTEYTYDNNGNLISETQTDGDYKVYAYENGLKTEMLHYQKKGGDLYDGSTYYYDGNGFLIQEINRPYYYMYEPNDIIITYQRADNGKLLTMTTTKAGILDTYYENEYDGNGNLLKQSYYSGADYTLTSVDEYEYESAAAYFGKSGNYY